MKKIFLLLLLIFTFSGCASNSNEEEETRFTLNQTQQENYKTLIDEELNSFYWYYDEQSLAYFQSTVPVVGDATKLIFEASKENGYDLEKYSGRGAVVYTVDLMHFNKNKAGTAYFYFVKNSIVGTYYVGIDNADSAYGFKTRNVFSEDTQFVNYETDKPDMEYKSINAGNIPDGFMSETIDDAGNKQYLNIVDGALLVYKFKNDRFSLVKNISYWGGNGRKAMSATFYDGNKIAVLLGSQAASGEECDGGRLMSEKLVFLNEDYSLTGEEMVLTNSAYSCVVSVEDRLILINDKNIEVYASEDGEWKSKTSYYTNVQATAFLCEDLDGDGIKEYLLTDGKDLYMYRKNGISLHCIWRTNISVESFYGYIYAGDTNNDDSKEIYICDNTGTAIRYTVATNGLVAKNDDISYSDRFYVSDFNNDGFADYIKSQGEEKYTKTVYIADQQ
ncbi:MAG: FG-GAP repeat domain-containing protein [Anaerotignaceae bacterium]